MAYIQPNAILTRIRELLDDNRGLSRKVASTRFSAGWHEALDQDEQSRRAVSSPRFDVSITDLARMPHTLPSANVGIWSIKIKIVSARHLNINHKAVDALRDDVLALANIDADVIAQAIGYLGNASATESATSTGLVGGKLELTESRHEVKMDGDKGAIVLTEHTVSGIVKVVHTEGVPALAYIYAMDAVTDVHSNGYYSSNVGYLRGSTTMTWAMVFYLESVPTALYGVIQAIIHGNISTNAPIYFYVNEGAFQFRIKDQAGSIWGTPVKTFTSADAGKYHTAVATYDSNVLRLYVDGVEVSSGNTTDGGITQDSASVGLGLLRQYGGGNVNPFYWIVGFAASETVALNSSQVASWHLLCKAQFACATYTGASYIWNARDIPNTEATWAGQVGGENLILEGGTNETTVHATDVGGITWG